MPASGFTAVVDGDKILHCPMISTIPQWLRLLCSSSIDIKSWEGRAESVAAAAGRLLMRSDIADEECDSPRIARQYTQHLRPKRLVSMRLISRRRRGVSHGTSSPSPPAESRRRWVLFTGVWFPSAATAFFSSPSFLPTVSLSDSPTSCFRHSLCVFFYQTAAFYPTHLCASVVKAV